MSYDVVVVGAGASGCALAARLSEHPDRTVALLEAGPLVGPLGVPRPADAIDGELLGSPARLEHGFSYAARAWAGGPPLTALRGRRVGGSSAVNGAFFLRGLPEDYDGWGSPLWSWEQVLPFLRAIEADRDFGGELHGAAGPVPVERDPPERWRPFHAAFYEAALAYGFVAKADLNDPAGSGIGPFPRNARDGLRVAADAAYLAPAATRPNLTLVPDSPVARVVVERGRATGVELAERTIGAGEVVLCAGAIETPLLLMRSGVGPPEQLRRAGIAVVADHVGVGAHLFDHPAVVLSAPARDGPLPGRPHQVVLSYTADERNDMQMLPTHAPGELRVVCALQRPHGSGHVRLRPDGAPEIDFGYLRDDRDRRRLDEAVDLALELLAAEPCRRLLAGPVEGERALTTFHHGCGTCRLGAVTDDHGRVRGVERLRVADLSLAPDVVRANTHATALLIGERVAGLMAA